MICKREAIRFTVLTLGLLRLLENEGVDQFVVLSSAEGQTEECHSVQTMCRKRLDGPFGVLGDGIGCKVDQGWRRP
jgi:hypothetical protein